MEIFSELSAIVPSTTIKLSSLSNYRACVGRFEYAGPNNRTFKNRKTWKRLEDVSALQPVMIYSVIISVYFSAAMVLHLAYQAVRSVS